MDDYALIELVQALPMDCLDQLPGVAASPRVLALHRVADDLPGGHELVLKPRRLHKGSIETPCRLLTALELNLQVLRLRAPSFYSRDWSGLVG